MSLRVLCQSCRTAFLTDDDRPGARVACPKCGAKQGADPTLKPARIAAHAPSVFIAADPNGKPRRGRRLALGGLAVLLLAGVGIVVAWPALQRWWRPTPPDPVESVASAYLKALSEGDAAAAERLGAVELPPAIRSYRNVHRDARLNRRVKGSFAPITALHAKINETYVYDKSIGRYTPKNPLGPAAETLDALHDPKTKAEQEAIAKKIAGGNPDDLFDAAEALAKSMAKLSEGILSPKKLIPSYKQLVTDAKPPLPPAERELSLDAANRRETWDRLLKRPFPTLKSDGPFIFDRTEVTASVIDSLGSAGDPPTTLHMSLTRFRLEGIDTGWRVTSTHRAGRPTEPASEPEPEPAPPPRSGSLHGETAPRSANQGP